MSKTVRSGTPSTSLLQTGEQPGLRSRRSPGPFADMITSCPAVSYFLLATCFPSPSITLAPRMSCGAKVEITSLRARSGTRGDDELAFAEIGDIRPADSADGRGDAIAQVQLEIAGHSGVLAPSRTPASVTIGKIRWRHAQPASDHPRPISVFLVFSLRLSGVGVIVETFAWHLSDRTLSPFQLERDIDSLAGSTTQSTPARSEAPGGAS